MSKKSFEQVLVVGGTGQTGHRVVELFLKSPNTKIIATSRDIKDGAPNGPLAPTVIGDAIKWAGRVSWAALDLEAEGPVVKSQLEVISKTLKPGVSTAVVIAAAFTNVDGCETDPEKCRKINETNTEAIVYWARQRFGAKVAFYSTDYVFDGADGPYSETHKRRAICQYGQSKQNVEEWLERNAPDSVIIRTTGVFDYLPGSKNFLMQMFDLWGQKKQTRIPSDQLSNPVWAYELAKATIELLEAGASGVYHVAGGEYVARHEFAGQIARTFGYDEALITPVKTVELAQKARRPLRGGLKCEKLKKQLGWAPQPAQAVLEFFRENTQKI
jgi:dTDP-4-dehydrorhamnose reductase